MRLTCLHVMNPKNWLPNQASLGIDLPGPTSNMQLVISMATQHAGLLVGIIASQIS